ncbi:MAG: hypothetical protein QXM93_00175 [Candidatus Methanomethyliaceae archaeon]
MRYVNKTIAVTILMSILLSLSCGEFVESNGTKTFTATLKVVPVDPAGNILQGADVKIYVLSEDGVQEFMSNNEATTDFLFDLCLPLKMVGNTYASVNILVTVLKGDFYGQWAVPIDPSSGADIVEIKIPLINLTKVVSSPPEVVILTDSFPCYKFTPVLSFATWTNISGKYEFPVGSKVRVQSKWRVYGYSQWYDGGSTDITVDGSVTNSTWATGQLQHDILFELKYDHTINNGGGQGAVETVFAVDTTSDPRDRNENHISWDGNLPTTENYYMFYQNDQRSINIGGSNTEWILSVGFTYYGLSLGITRQPNPPVPAVLTIKTDQWISGYRAKTCACVGDNFQKSVSNWIYG